MARSKERKNLDELTKVVSLFIHDFDALMRKEPSVERGKEIAKYLNWLELHNGVAMRYGLDFSFNKIKKRSGGR